MADASPSKSPNLTTKEGLMEYLKDKYEHVESVDVLAGGTANFVYRVTFKDRDPMICKHAAAYLSSNSNFYFDSARMDYEARALGNIFQSEKYQNVRAVQLHDYDAVAKLITMEDGGKWNLKEAYTDSGLDIKSIAYDLAAWLANLHTSTREFSLASSDDTSASRNNPIAVAIYRHSYKNLHHALDRFGFDTTLADRINEEYGSRLVQDDECVVQGDCWPGNILVKEGELDGSTSVRHDRLTIVDWEMVRRGTSATDVAQFAAEAFLLDRFRGSRGLRAHFLTAYFGARKDDPRISREWIKRLAVHWAVHIAFWPTRVQWTDDAGTRELVDIGVNVLKAVLADDMESVIELELFHGAEGWTEALGRV